MTDCFRLDRGEYDPHSTGNYGENPFRGQGTAEDAFHLDHLDDAHADIKRLRARARDSISVLVAIRIRSLREKRRYERALRLNGEVT